MSSMMIDVVVDRIDDSEMERGKLEEFGRCGKGQADILECESLETWVGVESTGYSWCCVSKILTARHPAPLGVPLPNVL